MGENDQGPVSDPLTKDQKEVDFKSEYIFLENRVGFESEILNCLAKLTECIKCVQSNTLGTEEHTKYFLGTALSKIIQTLLKRKIMDDSVCRQVNSFLKLTLDLIISHLPTFNTGPLQTLIIIFDSENSFYLSKGGKDEFNKEGEIFSELPSTTSWGSEFLVENINYFGRQGGFNQMLQLIKSTDPRTPLSAMSLLIEAIWTVQNHNYLVEQKLQEYVQLVKEVIPTYLLAFTEDEIKAMKKENLENLIKHTTNLLSSSFNSSEVGSIIEPLCLEFALKCFKSPFLEKRIYGLNYINEMIAMVRRSEYSSTTTVTKVSKMWESVTPSNAAKWVNTAYLISWIQKNEILEQMFGKSTHNQFLKRAGDIIRFMAQNQALKTEHIDLVLNCSTVSHNYRSAIFKVLGENCFSLLSEHIDHVFNYIMTIPRKSFTTAALNFVNDLSRNCRETSHKLAMMELLWQLVIDESPNGPPLDICTQALKYLQETVTELMFRPQRWAWIKKIIDVVKQNTSVVFCLELLKSIIATFPFKPLATEPNGDIFTVVKKLQTEHGFIDLLFDNLVIFKKSAVEMTEKYVKEKEETPNWNTKVLGGRLEFLQEIKIRLDFIMFILTHYPKILNTTKYELLWDTIVPTALTEAEKDEIFQWFINARNEPADAYVAVDPPNAVHLFVEKMSKLNFATLSITSFRCFRHYFIETNVKKKKMSSTKDDPPPFEVLELDLVGVESLWEIVLTAENSTVVKESIDFLNEIHYDRLSSELKNKYGKIKLWEDFISACIAHIEHPVDTPSEINERKLERCLTLLTTFCKKHQTESSKGRSHGASTRGKPITVVIHNLIDPLRPEIKEIDLHSNVTVAEIKKRITPMLGTLALTDIVLTTKRNQLFEDTKTLQELCFDNKQVISVARTQESLGQETVHRSRVRTNRSESVSDAEKAKKLVDEFGAKGILLKAAKLALKKAQNSFADAYMLLSNEKTLEEIKTQAELVDSEDEEKGGTPSKTVQEEITPSTILARSPNYFNHLFGLLDLRNKNIKMQTWDLLMIIPTSQGMLENLYTLNFKIKLNVSNTPPNWNEIFDLKSPFKLLYSLQIIDSLLFPLDESSDISKRAKWCQEFLSRGGFEQLFQILVSDIMSAQEMKSSDVPPQQMKNCLALILKIFDFFVNALTKSSKSHQSKQAPTDSASEEEKNFSGLIHYLSENIASQLMSCIEFPALISRLISVLNSIISQPAPDRYDGAAVAYLMRLVNFCVSSNPREYWTFLQKLPGFDEIIKKLLLECPEQSVRIEASEGIYQLSRTETGTTPSPHSYFLDLLLKNLPNSSCVNPSVYTKCGQYFHLLERAINDSCEKDKNQVSHFHDLLIQLANQLKERPVVEVHLSEETDEILVGMMNVACTLVKHDPPVAAQLGPLVDGAGLVHHLYHDCLFAISTDSREGKPPLPKCKAKASRITAFNLLVELCRKCPKNLTELLALLLRHHTGTLKITNWDYHPGSEDRNQSGGYVGLVNLGATCYMNSLLQQFHMIPRLRYGILGAPVKDEDEADRRENLLFQLQTIFSYLQESQKPAFAAAGFCYAYKDYEGKATNVRIQQDVDEFFNILCQRLEEQLKQFGMEKLLNNCFGGTFSNEIRSLDKEYPYFSGKEEGFYTISLDVRGKKNLEESLDSYVEGDKLEGDNAYYCDKFDRKIDALKRCCIKKLSDTLILHLKRFDFDFNNYKKYKVNDYFEFPTDLCMKPWTREGLLEKEGVLNQQDESTEPQENHPDSYYKYTLCGVLVHSGTADAGHYYSYIKEKRVQPGKEPCWFEFNDEKVTPFDPKDIPAECFGGTQWVTHYDNNLGRQVKREYTRSHSAYLLIYERVEPLGADVIHPSVTATASGDQKASSPIVDNPFFSPVFINKLQDLAAQQQGMNQSFVNGVPAILYNSAWKENAEYMRDKQFFDKSYFDFLLDVTKLKEFSPIKDYSIELASLEGDTVFSLLKTATFFFIEILAHARETTSLRAWVDQLKHLFENHIPACKWLLQYLMETGIVKELVLECPNEQVRIGFAEIIVHVMKSLGPHEYDFFEENINVVKTEKKDGISQQVTFSQPKSIVVQFMDSIFSLLEESRVHWKRFKQYFMIIRDFALFGWHERAYLLKIGIFDLYADYFMGRPKKGQRRRTSVMDQNHLPDLVEFISTLSAVCRGCDTGAPKEKGYPPTTITDGKVLPMPPNAVQELFETSFFSNMLEMDYNTQAAVEIILHSCWEDLKRTKWVLEIILKEISMSSHDKLPVWQSVLSPLLGLHDSFQQARVHMTLSPFSEFSKKGLLALLHEQHHHDPKFAGLLIKVILHLANNNKIVTEYLQKNRWELEWVESFLEARMGPQNQSSEGKTIVVKKIKSAVDSDESDEFETTTIKDTTQDTWKKDSTFLTYVAVKKLLATNESDPSKECERLRNENQKLRELLEFYKKNCTCIQHPPDFH